MRIYLLLITAVISVLSLFGRDIKYYPTIIELEENETAEKLESQGIIVWGQRSNLVLSLIPASLMNTSERIKGAHKIEKGRKITPRKAVPAMNVARQCFNADEILTGTDTRIPYTGKDVVVGFCDIGFDPNHINFIDAEGNNRIKKLVHYDELNGERTELSTPEEYEAWGTDTPHGYHATHVAGILAGGYRDNGYNGFATDSDIVATTSTLYDIGLLAGIEDVITYAKEVGKPAVINLSICSYLGSHDGKSLFCRYVDMQGEDAIIVFSAGNGGSHPSFAYTGLSHIADFTEDEPVWGAKVYDKNMLYHPAGMIEAWSADERPVGIKLSVIDMDNNQIMYEGEMQRGEEEFAWSVSSESDSEFAKICKGDVKITGEISNTNGRWLTQAEYDVTTTEASRNGAWARYTICFEFTGAPGTHADIHIDGGSSFFSNLLNYPWPGSELALNDFVTARNVISVGMYNTRNAITLIGGDVQTFNYEGGTVNTDSSYGTLHDGRKLPLTVAPGAPIVSSVSSPFCRTYPDYIGQNVAKVEKGGKTYYWGIEQGTSMASPYTAGVIATWLEADRTLNVHRVQEVIAKTNRTDYPDPENPRHGMGWLDPLAGLQEVVRTSSAPLNPDHTHTPAINAANGVIEILNPGAGTITVEICGIDGRCIFRATANDNIFRISAAEMSGGVYIVRVSGKAGSASKKILI
ncbi:MAG: S8 family peptidase [Candidatus Amulumruptor caecigallinarius]|nr:S8 family peptidase [Candidatus Amulumruptor caecigallinarius]